MADRGSDRERVRNIGGEQPRDAGKTSGGGSLGHRQPEEVTDEAPLRNNPKDHPSDPAMPADDATLKTKI